MDDWKSLLKSVIPTLATAAGGPIAGAAASFIASKLGLESQTIEAVTEVLNSGKLTPEQLSQLKLAEIDFQKFLKSNDIKLEEIAAADRNSAREMHKVTRSYVPAALTFIVTTGYFIILIGMMLKQFAVADSQVMLIMLGQLGTAWGMCISFWLGTTNGSKDKTAMLANSTPAK